MRKLLLIGLIFLSGLVSSASAKETIKIVVPYTAGGLSDKLARHLQTYLANDDYDFIVENKVGAGGLIGAQAVADEKTKPLLLVSGQALVANDVLGNSKYIAEKDFTFISCLATDSIVVVANAGGEFKTVQDIYRTGKSVSYGTSGIGTTQHIVSPIVAKRDKNQIEIPFKGAPEVTTALLSGTVDWAIDNLRSVAPMIESGKFVILASSNKLKKYPGVPTFKELGIDIHGFKANQLFVANNAVSPELLNYIKKKLEDKEFTSLLESNSYESCVNTKNSAGLKLEKEIIKKLVK